jgi:hypothetical protein
VCVFFTSLPGEYEGWNSVYVDQLYGYKLTVMAISVSGFGIYSNLVTC